MADSLIEQTNKTKPIARVGSFLGSILLGGAAILGLWGLVISTPVASWLSSIPIDSRAAWYLTRSTATVAYLLLTASVVWGLILTTKIIKEVTPPPLVLGLHNWLSWLSIGLGSFHAFLLLFDNFYPYNLAHLLIPFIGPYRPGVVGLGTLGLYLLVLTSVSFSWRSWLGQKGWRLLHYLTFAAYVMVTFHGLLAGTDGKDLGMRMMYLGSVALVLFLTNYRLLAGQKQPKGAARSAV